MYSGRRLEELNPGEYKGTKNSNKPVVVEGHWEEPTPEEQQKHDTVHKLEVGIMVLYIYMYAHTAYYHDQ